MFLLLTHVQENLVLDPMAFRIFCRVIPRIQPNGAHFFKRLSVTDTITLLDPFNAVKPIEWLSLEQTFFHMYEEQILDYRAKHKDKTPLLNSPKVEPSKL